MGRPRKYPTAKAMQAKIDSYFKKCDKGRKQTWMTKRGEMVSGVRPIPYSIEGLTVHLDMDRRHFTEYGKLPEFSLMVSHAKGKIVAHQLERGLSGDYNHRAVQLVLQANDRRYNPSQHIEIEAVESLEQRLRRLRQERLAEGEPVRQIEAPSKCNIEGKATSGKVSG